MFRSLVSKFPKQLARTAASTQPRTTNEVSNMLRMPVASRFSLDPFGFNMLPSFMPSLLHEQMIDFANPKIDLIEKEKEYVVHFDVAGMKPENLVASFKNGTLILEGNAKEEVEEKGTTHWVREINTGSFTKSIQLPENVETKHLQAHLANGLLSINLPKKKEGLTATIPILQGPVPKSTSQQIDISASSQPESASAAPAPSSESKSSAPPQ